MPSPTPLWSDRSSRGPEHAWLERPTVPVRPPSEDPPPPEPPRPRRTRLIALGALAGCALALAALLGARMASDDDPQRASGPTAAPLPAAPGSLAKDRVGRVYEAVKSGVVQIRAGSGSGSGFVIDRDGRIVTNAHVVQGSKQTQVVFDDSGKPVRAKVLGSDVSTDLALLQVDPGAAPTLRPLALADSDAVQTGDTAIAIGYPLGLDRTVTAGIVSGVGREIRAPNGFSIDEVIQTDAPINPGNSGGPLLDASGRVIGVNSQIATAGSQGNVGIGFAVPSNTVREIVPQLENGGEIRRAFLGVSTSESPTGAGALVREVTPGGPAARAGLRAGRGLTGAGGDLVVSIEGTAVTGPDELAASVGARKPGEEVTIEVIRDGRRVTLRAKLGERPERLP